MKDVFKALSERINIEPGDYTDQEGFIMCGKCNTRRQTEIDCPFERKPVKMPIMCKCRSEECERQEEAARRLNFEMKVERLRRDGLSDPEYSRWTFESDDTRNPLISCACRKYVEEWEHMKSDNVGLLFYGNVGVGKTFYACCIANALLDKCVPVLVTSFPRILNRIQSSGWTEDRSGFIDKLQRYDLLVIDDLGVERSTDFALEQVFMVIDTRYRSGKPLIITTNLSPADIKKPDNIAYERVYDRILQNSLPVKMTGESRRKEIAARKREKYQGYLGLES